MAAAADSFGIASTGVQPIVPAERTPQRARRKPEDDRDTAGEQRETDHRSPPPGRGDLIDKIV
ncbi:MAG: hypothetical protein ACRECV_19225 [Xanthobacteraceae bacterium]